jgi:hypothetical protein
MSEFKISRLRFSWVGEWKDQYVYNKDEIVQFEGKAYVCLIPHTSNGFYADLSNIEPKWELMMTGQTWKGPWQQFTNYALDNIVIFGGVVYKCNEQHLSASIIDPDIDKWDVYAESKTWKSEWTSNTTYGPGDIVNYGGSAYECIIAHISAETDLLGLEADYTDIDDSTERYWKLSTYGVQYRGDYSTFSEDSTYIRYKLNDVVKYGPSLYKCIWGHSPGIAIEDFSTNMEMADSFVPEYWEEWLPGLDFDNVWDVDTFYQPGDVVLYGGYLFQSKIINNLGNKPSTTYGEDSTDAWEIISEAYSIDGDWIVDSEYKVGSVVRYGGDLYVALTDSIGQNPGSFEVTIPYESEGSSGNTIILNAEDSVPLDAITVGMTVTGEGFARGQQVEVVEVDAETKLITVTLNYPPDGAINDEAVLTLAGTNYAFWELLIPGFQYEGRWSEGRTYNADDVAYFGNATYKCTREHTSALVNRPDLDLQNNYWIIYLQHDQRNSLTTPGQMIVFDKDDGNIPLEIGDEASILKVINGLPTWSDIDFTPNVYYVATNGTDLPDRGTTPDTAWASIKYACEIIKEGTLQQNAKELIQKNKEWIVQETFYWFLYQQNQGIAPFGDSFNFDNEKVIRDSRQIVDAAVKDLTRGGNAQTVAAALSYFDLESTNRFTNDEIAAQAIYFKIFFVKLFEHIEFALTNTPSGTNYQQLEGDRLGGDLKPGMIPFATQYFNTNLVLDSNTLTIVRAFERIYVESFTLGSPNTIPPANESAYSTINIKAGTYLEELPIVVPCNSALNGDELRGTTVQPANPVNTLCTKTTGDINLFTVGSTVNMEHNTPVQFVSLNPINEISTIIGDVIAGQTYYVIGDSITPTAFAVSEEPDGVPFEIRTNIGGMYVYGGNALRDMFYVQNATGIRNMTVKGLRGTLTVENEYLTRRPTGGAYVSLDPGEGPDDTTAWITYKSPYIQNVTTFGKGCVGLKIDSDLHNGGNTSVTSNDFTQIISDGIGIWAKGGDALTEAVSVFSYYNYAGYFAEDGAKIRATNGNSSYGTFGVIAEGFDVNEVPAVGVVNNRDNEATAEAVSALGQNSEILKIQYTHAGEEYYNTTTNLLRYSNDLLADTLWLTDSNLSITRAATTPYENEVAWRVVANTSLTDSSYFYQTREISPQGRTYTNVSGFNISGSGIEATFDVTVNSDGYEVSVNNGGSGYVIGNQIQLDGRSFGGRNPENDIIITVEDLSITSISQIQHEGIVPEGSALPYNVSIHAKKGDTPYFDLVTEFSGGPTSQTNYVRYNFETDLATTTFNGNTYPPTNIKADFLEDGWYRISYTVFDESALNNLITFKIYPRGTDGIEGFTNFYGAQITIGSEDKFFVNTKDDTSSVYANLNISGAGTGVDARANELRTGSVFQARLLESEQVRLGGLGYNLQTNNAQAGNTEYLTLAQSEVATAAEYEGMRLVVNSGKGAGQYGIISNYDETTKFAYIVKESFDQQELVAVNPVENSLVLGLDSDFHGVYIGQKIQVTPTFYDIGVSSTSQSGIDVTGTLGDLNNYMFVSSTDRLRVGQKINFSGVPFGGVIIGFDYYIIDIIDERSIQISTSLGGAVWPLTNVNIEDPDDSPIVLTGEVPSFTLNYPDDTSYLTADTTDNMQVTLPIQFTGKAIGGIELGSVYYIQEVFNDTQFSISEFILTEDVTATNAANNTLITLDTSGLNPLTPIIFKEGNVLGGLQEKTKYYVNSIVSGTEFTLASDVITRTATASEGITNLITVDSTAGFIPNSPITFTGVTFGQIDNDKVYYIQVVNDATSFTISEAPGGAAVPLTTAVGEVFVRTSLDEVVISTDTGTMEFQTTGTKFVLDSGRDIMEGSFFTEIFAGLETGVTYYVVDKFDTNSSKEIKISETEGGAAILLTEESGSMQVNEVGWDHINAGTPLVTTFDSTSVYQIEPRITFDAPPFYTELMPTVSFGNGNGFCTIVDDNDSQILAIPNDGDTVLGTTDFTDWDVTYRLPFDGNDGTNGGWVDATYGNNTFFIMSKDGSDSLYSNSAGLTWLSVDMPTLPEAGPGEKQGIWKSVAYGNGRFVAIANNVENSAYSTNNCNSWTEVTGPIDIEGEEDWRDIAYGNEIFVAISGSSDTAKYSTDGGETWNATEITGTSTVDNWRAIEFGNGRFVAISEDDRPAVYSFDGITWYPSNVDVSGNILKYAQGVFVVINSSTGLCCTSADGFTWNLQTDTVGGDYDVCGFGLDPDTKKGWFMTINEVGNQAFKINAGCKAIARASVANARLTSISLLEPGSGYEDDSFVPNVKITDPNNSEEALIQVRVGNGTLGAPNFVSFGSGFNTTSTAISIRGNGFSDSFQTGLTLIAKEITRFPSPGDNLQFEGNPEVYRVAKAERLRGTEIPNLETLITLSPQLTQETAPNHNTPFTIRSRFSQCRITNHDFLNIGFGNEVQSNYPFLPEETGLEPQDEIQETNNGRVFYSSTDQDGNFRVGDLFAVEQATGVVTLSASEFGLEGLTELTIGGVALGGSPVVVSEFSTDGTFVANSNNIVPTQRAIRTYLASRLSQGGSDTFTGLLQAGTVKVGGPDEITSSVPEGGEGWQVKIGTKAMVDGPFAGWSGDGLAMSYFMKTFTDPTRGDLQ